MRPRGTKNRGTSLFLELGVQEIGVQACLRARGTKTVQNRGTKNRGTRLFLRPFLGYKNTVGGTKNGFLVPPEIGRGYKKRVSCTPRNRSGVQKTGFLYPSKSVGGTVGGGGYKENQGYTKIGRGYGRGGGYKKCKGTVGGGTREIFEGLKIGRGYRN